MEGNFIGPIATHITKAELHDLREALRHAMNVENDIDVEKARERYARYKKLYTEFGEVLEALRLIG